MLQLLHRLRLLNLKTISVIVLVFVVICLAAAVKLQHDQLEMAKVVYQNPRVVTVVKTVKVSGPVRVVTRTIERPTGERETTVDETRGEVVETTGESSESSPVPLDVALKRPNGDRWVAGIGNRNFSFRSWKQYSAWGGREMGPFIALGGLGYDESVEAHAVILVRFGK